MQLEKFTVLRNYLYHLTSEQNLPLILDAKVLRSTNTIIDLSQNKELEEIKRKRREGHLEVKIGDNVYSIRDQRPISELALSKCLTDNWTPADYYEHLNDRVFMWPTKERLERHFERYQAEKPVILRFESGKIIQANPHVKFSRLNSGATRANSYLGGIAPERGPKTFLEAGSYDLTPSSVVEVTFEKQCVLKGSICVGYHPDGPYKEVIKID